MGDMEVRQRAGRPKVSSREVLAEAACELFLERGYEATSIADITRRAGVSRSSFFNYFGSKSDLLWARFDERIAMLVAFLDDSAELEADSAVRTGIARIAGGFAPDSLALAIINATAMGIEVELERESAVRRARIADAVADRLRDSGATTFRAEVVGAAYAGAVWAAVEQWAVRGGGRVGLQPLLDEALKEVVVLCPHTGLPLPPS